MSALRNAWSQSTAPSPAPFARAVVMKSCRITSVSDDFEYRAKIASCPYASVIDRQDEVPHTVGKLLAGRHQA